MDDDLRQLAGRLAVSTEALGALGAVLRLRYSGQQGSPEVEARLAEVIEALGATELIENVDPAELAPVLSLIRTLFVQSLDLLSDPARAPGWSYTDPELLESQGQVSAAFAGVLKDAVAPALGDLEGRLESPGAAFLDVGVGVAALSVAMCRLWPSLRAVGIDPWDPALALARRNVTSAGLADRVELRHQGVEELRDEEVFDLAWVSGPFLPRDVLDVAVERVHRALRPEGWAILGAYRGAGDLGMALARLRTVRSGGSVLSAEETAALLEGAGFVDVRVLPEDTWAPGLLIVGRHP